MPALLFFFFSSFFVFFVFIFFLHFCFFFTIFFIFFPPFKFSLFYLLFFSFGIFFLFFLRPFSVLFPFGSRNLESFACYLALVREPSEELDDARVSTFRRSPSQVPFDRAYTVRSQDPKCEKTRTEFRTAGDGADPTATAKVAAMFAEVHQPTRHPSTIVQRIQAARFQFDPRLREEPGPKPVPRRVDEVCRQMSVPLEGASGNPRHVVRSATQSCASRFEKNFQVLPYTGTSH